MSDTTSSYYFIRYDENGICRFYDSEFNLLEHLVLDGLFAFIRYDSPALMVIGRLSEYRTGHKGLEDIVTSFRKHADAFQNHFFKDQSHIRQFKLPKGAPVIGGSILYLGTQSGGEIVLWHLKSGTISRNNPSCHDDHPELQKVIQATGLPPDRFIKLTQANLLDELYLRALFLPNGQYKNPKLATDVAKKLSKVMELRPVYELVPIESNEEQISVTHDL